MTQIPLSPDAATSWKRVALGNVVDFRSGSRNTNTATKEGLFPFFVCSKEVLRCDQYDFDCEAVIMAGNNADGIFHLHYFAGRFAARQRTYVVTPSTNQLECRWLFHQMRVLQPQFQAAAIGTTTRYLTVGMLLDAPIFLPPVEVQRATSDALADVDQLLECLDRLVAKRRDLKQAAMQTLLTGESRLPGFQGKWEESTVGREFDIQLGKMLDAERNVGVPKPFIGNKAVQWNRIDINDLPTVPMSRSDIDRFRLRKGDLVVCEGGEVGRAAIWNAPIEECYYQKALHRLRPVRGFDPRLMAALLRLWSDRGLLANYVTQTSIAHLPREKFLQIPLLVPSRDEQTAIADVLSDMDAELSALEARRDKTRLLKEAMMQELLTGRTRLV
jgi:restriction endonuclease S subunit